MSIKNNISTIIKFLTNYNMTNKIIKTMSKG